MTLTDFGKYIEIYLGSYLRQTRGFSNNTIRSYRDTFKSLLRYFSTKGIKPEKLELKHITKDSVLEFLSWLESNNHNSISTRNNRLAAINSFLKFVMTEEPERIYAFQAL